MAYRGGKPIIKQPIFVFGNGNLIVQTGVFEDRPAVFIRWATEPGEVGAQAPDTRWEWRHAIEPNEEALTFPTEAQAQAVCDALCGGARSEKKTDQSS